MQTDAREYLGCLHPSFEGESALCGYALNLEERVILFGSGAGSVRKYFLKCPCITYAKDFTHRNQI